MSTKLYLADAVAALILVEGQGYLMQLRDERPDIWYPGHWGLFGGAVDPGEEPLAALKRELHEELELEFAKAELFSRFDFDLGPTGLDRYYRSYYVVEITPADLAGLRLHEGAAMRVFSGEAILKEARVTPYDDFVLFLHHARARLGSAKQPMDLARGGR
jgi:8-oxo-dGTP pyrophosphatase MutT (NUDIX family)